MNKRVMILFLLIIFNSCHSKMSHQEIESCLKNRVEKLGVGPSKVLHDYSIDLSAFALKIGKAAIECNLTEEDLNLFINSNYKS